MRKKNGKILFAVLGLLFFATTMYYIDQQVIGILKPYQHHGNNIKLFKNARPFH